MYKIYNEDCIEGAKRIEDNSVDLIICDPPFGINEGAFNKHYNRDSDKIIEGYVEAPNNYDEFTLKWITECKRILKEDGSMYIISGWSNLYSFYKAFDQLELNIINHIIWKYNFGVATKSKWVTSHYHIFYISKNKKSKLVFNKNAVFSQIDKDDNKKSLQYSDMEDVWIINKEYSQEIKNMNKLPCKLIEKIIKYSSNKDQLVCDFFMGNFTTADCALRLGRNVVGFELNKNSYDYWMDKLKDIEYGTDVIFSLKYKVKSLIYLSFYNNGFTKNSRTYQILGCSFEEFKLYLENRFESWMNWENRGLYNGKFNYGWDIDHIIPISSAKTEDDIIKLNHYTNLQPLCSKINRDIKRAKY